MSFGFGGRRLSGVDLLGLGDLKVTAIDERHDGVTVDAEAIELDGVPVCECGGSVYKHGMRTISVRDSTIRRLPTVLRIKRRRYRCQACGSILMNRLAGLRDDRDMTERLRKQIAEDAIDRTFTDAATLNGVNDAVQRAGRGYDFETLRAKALLRYGPFRYEAANKMNFLTFLRYHGVDLSTFEDDLRAGRF